MKELDSHVSAFSMGQYLVEMYEENPASQRHVVRKGKSVLETSLNHYRYSSLLLFPIFWEVGHGGSCCDLCQRVFCLCSPLGVL